MEKHSHTKLFEYIQTLIEENDKLITIINSQP